jgi:hypothetical protein
LLAGCATTGYELILPPLLLTDDHGVEKLALALEQAGFQTELLGPVPYAASPMARH